jgi:hypothetical protein
MLTDNFVAPIALDELCAGIPCDNVARRIEHEYRVILHAIDEEAKALLAFVGGPA